MTKYRFVFRTILISALVTCAGIANEAAATPPAYHVTDLGTLGGTESRGYGINDSGQVTGGSNGLAFLWTPSSPNGASGTMIDLGTLSGTFSIGYGINDNGQVTGSSDGLAFLWTPTTPNGASGTMNDLGTLGGIFNTGRGINDSGQVSGSGIPTGNNSFSSHALLWTPTTPNGTSGTINDLGTLPGGFYSYGYGINADGQITGESHTSGGLRAFRWTPTTPNGASGSMNDLGTLGGAGWGINDSGLVTGEAVTGGASRAFLYDGTLHDLGTLGGTNSTGYGINDAGQVTGYSQTIGNAAEHAFLYTSGPGMVDLNTVIDPLSGWVLQVGYGINDAGQITGSGSIGGQGHAFLLTPVPEPMSLALLALGLPILLWRNSRRPGTRVAHGPMTDLLKL